MLKIKYIKHFALLSLIFVSLALFNCKKYEENNLPSFRTVKTRLCREWNATKYIDTKEHLYSEKDKLLWEFNKDNTFKQTIIIDTITDVSTGTWEFVNNKEYILVNLKAPVYDSMTNEIKEYISYIFSLKFIKLTKQELIFLKEKNTNNVHERYELVSE